MVIIDLFLPLILHLFLPLILHLIFEDPVQSIENSCIGGPDQRFVVICFEHFLNRSNELGS